MSVPPSDSTLTVTSVTSHPVLLAVDEFQALYGKTAYRNPHFVPIHSYHLGATWSTLREEGHSYVFFSFSDFLILNLPVPQKRGAFIGPISSFQSDSIGAAWQAQPRMS